MDIICARDDFFKNPEKLPLNELHLEYKRLIRTSKEEVTIEELLEAARKPCEKDLYRDRYEEKVEKKPALDKCWVESDRKYVTFQSYYPQFDESENEHFLERNQEFLETLVPLVECTYHQFWCYIKCEPRVSFVIIDFLRHSPPLYSTEFLNEEFLSLYEEIYSCVCSIYGRLLKFNLSETEYMPEDVVLEIFKSTELLSSRSVLALCYLYNSTNPSFIKKLADFCLSDKNKEGFCRDASDMLTEVLEEMDKFCYDPPDGAPTSVMEIYQRYKPGKFDPEWLEETSLYLLELAAGLHEFFCACKPAVKIAFTLELTTRVSHLYQKVYLAFYELLEEKAANVEYDWSRYKLLINQWLKLGRSEFIGLFHGFTCYCIDEILRLKDDRQAQENYLETYIHLISCAMEDDLFMKDYNLVYPLSAQFQLLNDNITEFDTTQTEYLLKNLETITAEPPEPEAQTGEPQRTENVEDTSESVYEFVYNTLSQYLETQESSPSQSTGLPIHVKQTLAQYFLMKERLLQQPTLEESVPERSEEEIEKSIQTVLEMLPDLGSGFILKCLERMDYNPQEVISGILDQNLPLELFEVPRNLTRGEAIDFAVPGPSRLDFPGPSRLDLPGPSGVGRTKAEPKLIGYIGKKPGYADAMQLLDDKKAKAEIKDFIIKTSSYTYDLDDDYDDRNDIANAFEKDDAESKMYRYLKQPELRQFANASESESDSDAEDAPAKPKDAFCEDPAVIRARRANQRGRVFNASNRNVVGRPKGQGQEQSVKHNRDNKTVHKSTKGNHNRRGGAQWKRSRGMIPS